MTNCSRCRTIVRGVGSDEASVSGIAVRPRLMALLILLGTLLMSCGSGASRTRFEPSAAPNLGPTTAAFSESESAMPSPSSLADRTTARTCSTADLVLEFAGTSAATGGQLIAWFRLINDSSAPCRLDGRPRVALETDGGQRFIAQEGSTFLGTPSPVLMPGSRLPTETAWVVLLWHIHDGSGDCSDHLPPVSRVRLMMPDGGALEVPAAGTSLDYPPHTPCKSFTSTPFQHVER
jgi:hypothetical protein